MSLKNPALGGAGDCFVGNSLAATILFVVGIHVSFIDFNLFLKESRDHLHALSIRVLSSLLHAAPGHFPPFAKALIT